MSYLVLARKWRPQRLDDLVGQEAITKLLVNALKSNKVSHAYIFSGPRGVGKTSTARILAKTLNCYNPIDGNPCGECQSCIAISNGSSMDVIEIDGASNNSVNDIRELRETVKYAPSSSRYKVYIVDEAHMLSSGAFNAFLKTLEEPPPHVIFILATTEPRKIPVTILSRCQHLPFKRIAVSKIKNRLKEICSFEGFKTDDSALDIIARMSEGSMRDALTTLDQIVSFSDSFKGEDVKDLFGLSSTDSLASITEAVLEGNQKEILQTIQGLVDAGIDLKGFTKDLLMFVRAIMLRLAIGDAESLTELDDTERSAIERLSGLTSFAQIAFITNELIKTELAVRQTPYPRVVLEMGLLKLSMLNHFKDIDKLIRELSKGKVDLHIPQNVNINQKMPHVTLDKDILQQSNTAIDLNNLWKDVCREIEKQKILLASALREGNVSFPDEYTVELSFKGGATVHSHSVEAEIPYIKETIKRLTGRDFKISINNVEGTQTRRDLYQEARNHPVVKEVLRLYDGIIVDVKENKSSGGQ